MNWIKWIHPGMPSASTAQPTLTQFSTAAHDAGNPFFNNQRTVLGLSAFDSLRIEMTRAANIFFGVFTVGTLIAAAHFNSTPKAPQAVPVESCYLPLLNSPTAFMQPWVGSLCSIKETKPSGSKVKEYTPQTDGVAKLSQDLLLQHS